MQILVLNCGSSSIKAAVIDAATGRRLADVRALGIGERRSSVQTNGETFATEPLPDHDAALEILFGVLTPLIDAIEGVGHRVVHGGEHFEHPTLIDDKVDAEIDKLASLAPLHNPICLAGIRAARRFLPKLPHVAVFDTAFHATIPAKAFTYALPQHLVQEFGIRRYGFHGISHEFIAHRAADYLKRELNDLNLITCHLGNGCSITAVEHGRSVDTSMGMTPLEGLVMGSRSGDIDPGVIVHLLREQRLSVDELDGLLNRQSGLLGLTGLNDMAEIERRADDDDTAAGLAIDVFCYRVLKYIGAFAAAMGGADAIVFTGGIGQNSTSVRQRIAEQLHVLGAQCDASLNVTATVTDEEPVKDFATKDSPIRLLVAATDEEQMIANLASATLVHPNPQ